MIFLKKGVIEHDPPIPWLACVKYDKAWCIVLSLFAITCMEAKYLDNI